MCSSAPGRKPRPPTSVPRLERFSFWPCLQLAIARFKKLFRVAAGKLKSASSSRSQPDSVLLLLSLIGGFHFRADVFQHSLHIGGVLAIGSEREILLERVFRARGHLDLTVFIHCSLAHHKGALDVVSISFVGIGGDRLVARNERAIGVAGVVLSGAQVEI